MNTVTAIVPEDEQSIPPVSSAAANTLAGRWRDSYLGACRSCPHPLGSRERAAFLHGAMAATVEAIAMYETALVDCSEVSA